MAEERSTKRIENPRRSPDRGSTRDSTTLPSRAEHIASDAELVLQAYILSAQGFMESHPEDSEKWRAARKLDSHASQALEDLRRNDAYSAVYNTYLAAHFAWHLDIDRFEPEILTGRRTKRGAEKGNASKAAKASADREAWQKRATELWEKNPKLTATDVARIINSDRADYIRKRITRP